MQTNTADQLLRGISELVTAPSPGAKRGKEMRALLHIRQAAIAIANGRISWIGEEKSCPEKATETIDLGGRAVIPGLIDPHTHAIWGGDRLSDFDARTSGVSYEEILSAGGGIWHTIRETQNKTNEELVALALPRVQSLIRSGATTIEIKSGYGYSIEAELRMLECIALLQNKVSARLVSTLLVHIAPKDAAERKLYRERICRELIPSVARRQLADAVDIFVEEHAWNVDDAAMILGNARSCGLKVKLHTEQFQNVGGLKLGLRIGALSVDHLEVCSVEQCRQIATSDTVATILPGVSLHLGLPAAPGRVLVDSGASVAIGTDLNPGSSPLPSTAMAMALAVRINGLTASEALTASTVNSAAALGLQHVGCLQAGAAADFLVLESNDWRDIAYTLGQNVVKEIWIAGERQSI